MWIIFLCGLGFVMAGTVILVKRSSRINTLLVTLILLILGAIGVWVTLFSHNAWFVGGFTVLNENQNIVLARWMFGIGAILSFIMSGYGIQQFLLSLIPATARPPHSTGGKATPSRLVKPRLVKPRSVKPRPVKPRLANPPLGNPHQDHRRTRPNLLIRLLYPNRPVQRRYRKSKRQPAHPSRPFQSNRHHSQARPSPSSSRRR